MRMANNCRCCLEVRAIDRLTRMLRRHGRGPYWIRIDGCAYGLQWQGMPLRKAWTILTSSRELWLTLNKRCDRSHEHAECRGIAAQASSYYPQRMCKEILKGVRHAWQQQVSSLERDVEKYIFHVEHDRDLTSSTALSRRLPEGQHPGSTMAALLDDAHQSELPGLVDDEVQHHQILALSRKRIDAEEAPKGKRLEAVKQLMLRVHRASDHAGMSNLVQLLKARGSPGWALELAANLECPERKEASKPRPRPPAGTNETPNPFEQVGADVFEYEEKDGVKHKMILWRDRATGLTMVDHLARYESGAWEPKSQNVIESLTKWLMTYPQPKWILSDAARYYTSSHELPGVGLATAPAEAHWIMGPDESTIGILKKTVERLQREGDRLEVAQLFQLAAAATNSHVGPSGFSAYQWAFGHGGGVLDDQLLLKGIEPRKAFDSLVKEREKAKIAFERERAGDRFSKLANAVGRKASSYKPGQLVMVWRQKVRPGKAKCGWSGPLRLVLMEGSTAWLVSGATFLVTSVASCSYRQKKMVHPRSMGWRVSMLMISC